MLRGVENGQKKFKGGGGSTHTTPGQHVCIVQPRKIINREQILKHFTLNFQSEKMSSSASKNPSSLNRAGASSTSSLVKTGKCHWVLSIMVLREM